MDKPVKKGLFGRLREKLGRSRSAFDESLGDAVKQPETPDPDLPDKLEEALLLADVGMDATQRIMKEVHRLSNKKQQLASEVLPVAKQAMLDILGDNYGPLATGVASPFVIMVVGINGAGKTTTIGKLALQFKNQGKSVMLAAGDTFRAAAIEQLQKWGERNEVPVIAQAHGSDSGAVAHDAMLAAKARGADILIIDTAGRLHTQDNLMAELAKIKRVIRKVDETAPHEVLMVIDGGTGQNAISQVQQFNETVELTGLAVTKLDGTAKGGVLLAAASRFKLPIRYIGVGEGLEDLRIFNPEEFIDALMPE